MRPLAWFLALALPRIPTAAFAPAFADKADLVTALRAWCSNPASAEAVHGPISAWNTSRVTDMSQLFYAETAVDTMSCMYRFNQDLNAWDVGQVTSLEGTFSGALMFNQPLGGWDVSKVTTTTSMFGRVATSDYRLQFFSASSFNQPLDAWNVGQVTSFERMFDAAKAYNQSLNAWDVSQATSLSGMFQDAQSFNSEVNAWDVRKVEDLSWIFLRSAFNRPLDAWNTASLHLVGGAFAGNSVFNQPLDTWHVGKVYSTWQLFYFATAFNQPLNGWDVGQVVDMSGMFAGAYAFNQPLDSWDTCQVTDMSGQFASAVAFNQDLSTWNLTKLRDLWAGDSYTYEGVAVWQAFNLSSNGPMANMLTYTNLSACHKLAIDRSFEAQVPSVWEREPWRDAWANITADCPWPPPPPPTSPRPEDRFIGHTHGDHRLKAWLLQRPPPRPPPPRFSFSNALIASIVIFSSLCVPVSIALLWWACGRRRRTSDSDQREGVSLRSIGRSLGGSARPIWTSTRLRETLLPAAQPPEIPSADVRLTELVGKGGMGKVYLGDWRGTPVAVKVLTKRREREKEELAFLRETSVLASLRHPCVCSFFGTLLVPAADGDEDEGRRPAELRPALVMEFLHGALYDLLHSRARPEPPLEDAVRLRIMHETAMGLEYLHSRAFMHRDVKTANVLLDQHRHAKISDFGLAMGCVGGGSSDDDDPPAGDGQHTRGVGTPRFIAPEVLCVGRSALEVMGEYDERCDVYSFGLLLWEVAHRAVPFAGVDGIRVAVSLAPAGHRPPLTPARPPSLAAVYEPLAGLIAACWHGDAAQRPSMAASAQELGRLLQLLAASSGSGTSLWQPGPSAAAGPVDGTTESRLLLRGPTPQWSDTMRIGEADMGARERTHTAKLVDGRFMMPECSAKLEGSGWMMEGTPEELRQGAKLEGSGWMMEGTPEELRQGDKPNPGRGPPTTLISPAGTSSPPSELAAASSAGPSSPPTVAGPAAGGASPRLSVLGSDPDAPPPTVDTSMVSVESI